MNALSWSVIIVWGSLPIKSQNELIRISKLLFVADLRTANAKMTVFPQLLIPAKKPN